jgi:selenocysteine lyase/cysteine desulfurase
MAHAAGAAAFIDAVHYAPHGAIHVQEVDCDFLVCSAYKFFGPHVGVLYGKSDALESLQPYKVRPAPNEAPYKFETGTQNHEGIAGALAAVDYLAALSGRESSPGRRGRILEAMGRIRKYESTICLRLMNGLMQVKGIHIYGIREAKRMNQRVPTVSFTLDGFTPYEVAAFLGQRGIFVWHGNFYAQALTERLGVEGHGGLVRVGLVHYNTEEEIDRLVADLHELADSSRR